MANRDNPPKGRYFDYMYTHFGMHVLRIKNHLMHTRMQNVCCTLKIEHKSLAVMHEMK